LENQTQSRRQKAPPQALPTPAGAEAKPSKKLLSSIIAGNGAKIKEEPMAIVKYPIPQRHLTTAIESLRELALRLELEASAFAQLPYRDAGALARDRLELAKAVQDAYNYFLSL
jgi:hypothetical protein